MGVVFEAHGPNGDAPTAIKVLKPEVARDDAAVAEFGDEAHATGAIDHENVVTILDRGVDRELHYIVMELVDGPPLDRLLQAKGRLPFKPVVKIGNPARGRSRPRPRPGSRPPRREARERAALQERPRPVDGLRDRQGHRLAPGLPPPRPPRGHRELRVAGAVPRQAPQRGDGRLLARATLYHALCGKAPFNGGSPQEIARRHVHTTPVPPCEAVPEVPRSLSKLVERMLAKRQADRPTTERVVHDLGCVLKGKVAIATGPAAPRVNPAALKGLRRTGIRGRRAASRG
jgi:serine/threonine protein kinase